MRQNKLILLLCLFMLAASACQQAPTPFLETDELLAYRTNLLDYMREVDDLNVPDVRAWQPYDSETDGDNSTYIYTTDSGWEIRFQTPESAPNELLYRAWVTGPSNFTYIAEIWFGGRIVPAQ